MKKVRHSFPNLGLDGEANGLGYDSPKADWTRARYSTENLGSGEQEQTLLFTIQIPPLHTVGCGAVLVPRAPTFPTLEKKPHRYSVVLKVEI